MSELSNIHLMLIRVNPSIDLFESLDLLPLFDTGSPMYTSTFHVPAPVAAPRVTPFAAAMAYQTIAGLRFAARLTARVAGALFGRLSRAVAERSDAHSRRSQTASLRHFAQQMMSQDPSFAADLFAAADRHDRGE
jgi:hypothetical protein